MNRKRYSNTEMCLFFGVSRSGYYDYVKRLDQPAHDAALAEIIRKQQEISTHVEMVKKSQEDPSKSQDHSANHEKI